MDRFIGKILDSRYEIIEIIGMGGMAVVYKAKCHRLNRYVALKVLKDEYAVDDDFRRRFYDESQAVAMLSHPNIVAVYDVSRTEGVEYIVMELIDGITLKEYMGRRGALSWNEVTFFALQIGKALEHAHSRGIVHRDIKPQNIMLLRDGTVKVADFGIARHISKQETYNMGEAIGSVHYVSPEQAKGSHIDNRADIYSFGVVMYEMLTGRLPFEGDTAISIALQHINSIALPPSDHVPGIPPVLEAITMKAMNPSLSRRYLSATEMLSDLEQFKNDPDFKVSIPKAAPALVDEPMGHTRRLNNTGEVDVPRFPARRESEAPVSRVQERRISKEDEEPMAPEKSRRAKGKESSGLPASLLFSVFAVILFFAGALYFMVKVIDPFGDPQSTKVVVPNLIGQVYEGIESNSLYADELENFELTVKVQEYRADVPKGEIYDQYPEAGREVNPGTEIRLSVSNGVPTNTLENYVGRDYAMVKELLEKSGITVTSNETYSDVYSKGIIISSVPAAGQPVQEGVGVYFTVSKGKQGSTIVMPDLAGLTPQDANVLLKAYGLKIGDIQDEVMADRPDLWGTIVWQEIPKDSSFEVVEGDVVNVHVAAAGEETPTEPDTTTEPTTTLPQGKWRSLTSDPYAGNPSRVIFDLRINLIQVEGDFTVKVTVNGSVEYEGVHNSAEQYFNLRLSGISDEYSKFNSVAVTQDGQQTLSESYEFKVPQ